MPNLLGVPQAAIRPRSARPASCPGPRWHARRRRSHTHRRSRHARRRRVAGCTGAATTRRRDPRTARRPIARRHLRGRLRQAQPRGRRTAVHAAAHADASLVRALDAQRLAATQANPGSPVFFAPPDGMSRLGPRDRERARRARRARRAWDATQRDAGAWIVDGARADAVVLATPAFAARVVAARRRATRRGAARIDRLRRRRARHHGVRGHRRDRRTARHKRVLVPKTDGRTLAAACSWSSTKWAHLDRARARRSSSTSAGHYGNEGTLALDDDALVATMLDELHEIMALAASPWRCA